MAELRPARILVVEDERNLATTLVERLEREKFEVLWAPTASDALREAKADRFDLALLDVGLPDASGFSVAQNLREFSRDTAIIFLTAMGNPEDRIKGLELGAEDYIVKPFHFKELLLRVQNVLKRARGMREQTSAPQVQIGRALIRFNAFEAVVDGQAQSLTHKECALLKLLVDRRGQVVSRDEILNEVWSRDEYPSPRTVDNFILKLRKLVEKNPEHPELIRSARGVGYILSEE